MSGFPATARVDGSVIIFGSLKPALARTLAAVWMVATASPDRLAISASDEDSHHSRRKSSQEMGGFLDRFSGVVVSVVG